MFPKELKERIQKSSVPPAPRAEFEQIMRRMRETEQRAQPLMLVACTAAFLLSVGVTIFLEPTTSQNNVATLSSYELSSPYDDSLAVLDTLVDTGLE